METYVPFCGTPPVPSELWTRWTLDPALLFGLAAALAGLLWAAPRGTRRQPVAGWALAALLFVSPLCAASMALFSARVAQHLLLIFVAAPLLSSVMRGRVPPPVLSAIVFAGLFWLWHVPGPYALTLQSDLVYWLMHLSLLGAAVMLWASLRASIETAPFQTTLAAAGTGAQMTLLAVLLIFSTHLWHPWHALTTVPYGFGAMGDQALAGALMWVTGGLVLMALVAGLALRFLRTEHRRA